MDVEDAWGFDVSEETARGQSPNFRKWEGEDEDDCVMDSWDQEPEDCEGDASGSSGLDRSDEAGSSQNDNSFVPTQLLNDIQNLQEEADLKLAKDILGVTQTALETEDSYAQFKSQLLAIIEDATKNVHYASFAEDVVQTMCRHLTSNELKKIVINLSNLQIQKNSTKKVEKKKPKGKIKVKLRVEDDIHDYSEYSAYLEDDGYM